MPLDLDWRVGYALIETRGEPRLRDSKQLSAQQRDVLYEYIASHGRLKHAAAFVDAPVIDEIGIVNAAHEAAAVALTRLGVSHEKAEVLLDAGLRVPEQWKQRSFVRGDENVPAIALASIVAKVTRDRLMESLPENFAQYKFNEHKGYGTLEHRRAIARAGLSVLHRATFCERIIGGELETAHTEK